MLNNSSISKAVRILCVAHSHNAKTGDIAQTYTSANTCPPRCPFKGAGCYAESFHTRLQWQRTEEDAPQRDNVRAPADLREWIEQNTERGALIRHNVAGDIAKPGTNSIDSRLLAQLIEAFHGRRAYTYTHCSPDGKNLALARAACSRGFVVNFSCESLEVAASIAAAGVPAVVAVPAAVPAGLKVRGRRVVNCPAQTHENVTCKSCGLCARAGRNVIVAFAAHGSKKAIAIKAIEAANS